MPLSRSLSPWVKNSTMMRSVHCRYSSSGLVGLLKSAQWTMFCRTWRRYWYCLFFFTLASPSQNPLYNFNFVNKGTDSDLPVKVTMLTRLGLVQKFSNLFDWLMNCMMSFCLVSFCFFFFCSLHKLYIRRFNHVSCHRSFYNTSAQMQWPLFIQQTAALSLKTHPVKDANSCSFQCVWINKLLLWMSEINVTTNVTWQINGSEMPSLMLQYVLKYTFVSVLHCISFTFTSVWTMVNHDLAFLHKHHIIKSTT